jgi:hypothetical protein
MLDTNTDGNEVVQKCIDLLDGFKLNALKQIEASCDADDLDKALNRPVTPLRQVHTNKEMHVFC